MHNEPSVSVSRDRHFGGPKKSVTIYRNRRSHLTEMTGHALPKQAVTIGRNTHLGVSRAVSVGSRCLIGSRVVSCEVSQLHGLISRTWRADLAIASWR